MSSDTMNQKTAESGISIRKKIFSTAISAVLLLIIIGTAFLEFLLLTEYRPGDIEEVEITSASRELTGPGEELSILTWNCGYCALGENADYYADGGSSVYTADKERVLSNLDGIVRAAGEMSPDVIFFQEVDWNSARSSYVNEIIAMNNKLYTDYEREYTSAYAYDHKVSFVPWPIPPIGKVQSGLLTFCALRAHSAQRVRLPGKIMWPVRLVSPKRCLLVERVLLKSTDKELILINLHMDAADNEEDKEAQMARLQEIIDKETEKGNYVIAGGDFAQTFSSAQAAESGGGLQYLMDSAVPTRRSLERPYADADKENFRYYILDGFIVSSNIEVKSCSTKDLGFVCSDHNPVLMKCTLK